LLRSGRAYGAPGAPFLPNSPQASSAFFIDVFAQAVREAHPQRKKVGAED
jgi:hypothetical protein